MKFSRQACRQAHAQSDRAVVRAWTGAVVAHYVGDDPERITRIAVTAFATADVVFSCGGIGATPDDHTRHQVRRRTGQAWRCTRRRPIDPRARMQDVAREEGKPYEPERDNLHRPNMGVY